MINIQRHLQSMEQKCDIQIAWGAGTLFFEFTKYMNKNKVPYISC
jgi:hypothetical protein